MEGDERMQDYKPQHDAERKTWSMRYKRNGAWKLARLRDKDGNFIFATTNDIGKEKPQIVHALYSAWTRFLEDEIEKAVNHKNGMPVAKAWDDYYWFYKDNHRGRVPWAKWFLDAFGDKTLDDLTDLNVALWFESSVLPKCGAWDTARLAAVPPCGMINYLKQRKLWTGDNPFEGLAQRYAGRFKAQPAEKSQLEDGELEAMLAAARGHRAARIFIQVAYMTGLRPSEVLNLDLADLDRNALTWGLVVNKTRGRQFRRVIAIPAALVAFLTNESLTSGRLPLKNLRKQYAAVCAASGVDVAQKTFRKDFAHRMEVASAGPDIINLHQGRSQTGVLYANYLTDRGRAVRICRPFIDRMFGDGRLRIVAENN